MENNNQIQQNQNDNFDDLKTYLKIKKVNLSEDKSFIKISKCKTKLSFIDNTKRTDLEKSVTFENNKIFSDEENSYIYEEVCRDCIKDFIIGQNYCFFSYGLTHSGKTGLLFGGNNCITNINNHGIMFRFLDSLKANLASRGNHQQYTLNYSYICINSNKLIDLLILQNPEYDNFLNNKNNNINELDINSLIKEYKTITDITNFIIKNTLNDVSDIVTFVSKVRSLFIKLEQSDKKLYSKSHFCFFIYLTNLKTGKTSTSSFTILAGSEISDISNNMVSPNKNNNNNSTNGNISRTRDGIFVQNSFSTLLNVIMQLKSPDFKIGKFNEIEFDDSTLTYSLKTFLKNSKFRIVGTIVPNVGYQESVRDTLMFLFKFRKSVYGKKSLNQLNKNLTDKTDELLYDMENKLNIKDKHIQKLNDQIDSLNRRLEESENINRKNIETLKAAFNFDGDVVKLKSNDENIAEVKYARTVRDSMEQNKILNKRLKENEKKITDLREEIKKVSNEKRVIEDDRLALGNYLKIKEDNLHKENKMKIVLENSKELEELKRKNEQLEKKIEEYRKVIEENSKKLKNLPNILKENTEDRKEIAKKREELKGNLDKQMKSSIKQIEKKYNVEIESNSYRFELELKHKEDNLRKINEEFSRQKKQHEDEVFKINNELINFYELVNSILENYQKELEPLITKLLNNYFLGTNLSIHHAKTSTNFFSNGNTKERITSGRNNTIANTNNNIINTNNLVNSNVGNNVQTKSNSNTNCMNNTGISINLVFRNAKEKFDNLVENLNVRLNRYNFPILYENINNFMSVNNINTNQKLRPTTSKAYASNSLSRPSLMNLLKNTSKFNFITPSNLNNNMNNEEEISNKNNNENILKDNNNHLANDLEVLMEMNTNHMQVENNKDLSISASDISMEMEKISKLKIYSLEELEKIPIPIILEILNEKNSRIDQIEYFFNEVKKEKRGYQKNSKNGNFEYNKDDKSLKTLENCKDYIKKLEKENAKMSRKMESLVKVNLSLKIKKDKFESKLFENITTSNIGFNLKNEHKNILTKHKSTGLLKVEPSIPQNNETNDINHASNIKNCNSKILLVSNNNNLRPKSSTGLNMKY